jgi:hypothetical protein
MQAWLLLEPDRACPSWFLILTMVQFVSFYILEVIHAKQNKCTEIQETRNQFLKLIWVEAEY